MDKSFFVCEVMIELVHGSPCPVNSVNYEISTWRDLEKWFLAHIKLQKRFQMKRGCPFGTVGNELIAEDGAVREDLSRIFELVKGRLAAFFAKEKSEGRLAKNVRAELLADFCIATVQGGMLLSFLTLPVETTVREALAHLKGYSIARK